MFLGILRVPQYPTLRPLNYLPESGDFETDSGADKTFLDDFRVAFAVSGQ